MTTGESYTLDEVRSILMGHLSEKKADAVQAKVEGMHVIDGARFQPRLLSVRMLDELDVVFQSVYPKADRMSRLRIGGGSTEAVHKAMMYRHKVDVVLTEMLVGRKMFMPNDAPYTKEEQHVVDRIRARMFVHLTPWAWSDTYARMFPNVWTPLPTCESLTWMDERLEAMDAAIKEVS